ncbi:MAG: tetratricopeptide repeat protein, partial [Actinomycetota bacterium]|nr:tetratricopeptide repeat protein [Actinomycetota bacterium]
AAMRAEGEEAEGLWRYCLQSGDLMAHYALGYTLYELGRHREAYRHLRAYAELVPSDGWAWCWLGKAAEAIGEREEARSAYEEAIALDGDETDAPELLVLLLDGDLRRGGPPTSGPPRGEEGQGRIAMGFVGEAPELDEGSEIVLEDGVRRGALVVFEAREDGNVGVQEAPPGAEGVVYYVHPESTPSRLTFVRASARHLAEHRRDEDAALGELWKETFSGVRFFYRDADLGDAVLGKYRRGLIIRERGYVDCTYLSGGPAARHRYLLITGKARDLHALAGVDRRYGPAIVHRDAFFKVLDVHELGGRAQVTLLHVPEELVGHLGTAELNEMEEEMVEAARQDFEECLAKPVVEALAEPEWAERVSFPLGMDEDGNLFHEDPRGGRK